MYTADSQRTTAKIEDELTVALDANGVALVALEGRVFKNRIKIWYKKWCYIGVSKLLTFNTLTYKIALCKFA